MAAQRRGAGLGGVARDDGPTGPAGRLRRNRLALVLGLMAPVLLGSAAQPAATDQNCLVITGTQRDVLVTTGCTSPIGFCAGGTFQGNHGFRGTTAFSASAFVPIPGDAFGRLTVPGQSTYQTRSDGRIVVSDVSVFDTARGTFAGVGRIVEGTGKFTGATGDVFTYGHVSADGQSFTTTFVIELCLPKKPS